MTGGAAAPASPRAGTLAILSPSAEDGGAEEYLRMIAQAARLRGWQVHAGLPEREQTEMLREDLREASVACHSLDIGIRQPGGKREALVQSLVEAAATMTLLRRIGADATILVLPHPDQAPGAVFGVALDRSVAVTSVHLVPPQLQFTWRRRGLYGLAKRTGLRWIAVSQDNRARLARALGWSEHEITLVYNGVAIHPAVDNVQRQNARAELRAELGLPGDARLILTVGRLNLQKNHDLIVASCQRVLAAHNDAWWIWAGEGPARQELVDRIARLGLTNRVRLLGKRADVRALLAAGDLFLFPSRYEGLGLAVLEAHLAQLPVIVSDAGPLPEIVRDHIDGLVVPSGQAAALADATCWALEHDADMRRMAANGRERVVREFSLTAMADTTLALLEQCRS